MKVIANLYLTIKYQFIDIELLVMKTASFWQPTVMLLLLLSHFSHARLWVTPDMAAHQTPLSLGFSRQEHWSGLPFPSPMHEMKSESEVAQSCPTLCALGLPHPSPRRCHGNACQAELDQGWRG